MTTATANPPSGVTHPEDIAHMTPTTAQIDPSLGRMLRSGIFRHRQPDPDEVDYEGQDDISHVMVSSGAGDVEGRLIRWASKDGEVSYEVRIDGLEEHFGLSDVAAFDIKSLDNLAFVANNLRYEWQIITGVYPDEVWSVDPAEATGPSVTLIVRA